MTHPPSQMPDELKEFAENCLEAHEYGSLEYRLAHAYLESTRAASVPSGKPMAEHDEGLSCHGITHVCNGELFIQPSSDKERAFQAVHNLCSMANGYWRAQDMSADEKEAAFKDVQFQADTITPFITAPDQSGVWNDDMKRAAMADAAKVCKQDETINALAAALENTTIVELPSETESYKYKVTMAMMPMADWERVEKALALAKKAGV